jgi:hypothetical protein
VTTVDGAASAHAIKDMTAGKSANEPVTEGSVKARTVMTMSRMALTEP